MSDRAFFSLFALAVLALVALSAVFPQGEGRRSPGPFGHTTAAELKARQPKLRPATTAPTTAAKPPGML